MKLGDLAYYLFRPFVYVIDLTWGTDLRDCNVCKARRKKWNALPYSALWTLLLLTSGAWLAWRVLS